MMFRLLDARLGLSLAVAFRCCSCISFDPASYPPGQTTTVDVAVVGGGAAGTYAAVSLSDKGKSVVVIEATEKLGGMVDTYTDPETGVSIDYGVVSYQNNAATKAFFDRLGVPYTNHTTTPYNATAYVDFTKSQQVPGFTPGSNYTAYIAQLDRYPWMTYTSDIPSTGPVPPDLYLSVRHLITKYGLQSMAWRIFDEYGARLLDHAAFSPMSDFGLEVFNIKPGSTIHSSQGGNQAIYDAALTALGADKVLFNTKVVASQRNGSIALVVQSPGGPSRLVTAKRLVVAIPTTETNLSPFSLDENEADVFSQFYGTGYWIGVIRISATTGQDLGLAATQFRAATANETNFHIPDGPSLHFLAPTNAQGIWRFGYFSENIVSNDEAQAAALKEIENFVAAWASIPQTDLKVDSLAFKSHSPWHPRLSSDAIKNGYWNKTYALQGQHRTWYTGCQFLPASSQLYNYTASLIPDIVSAL